MVVDGKSTILIGMPTRGTPEAQAIVFAQMAGVHASDAVNVEMKMHQREPCSAARNLLVRTLLDSTCSHILFVDDDTTIPKHTIPDLLAADADLASGIVPFQHPAGDNGLVGNVYDGEHWVQLWPDGVFDATQAGTACLLIRRHVFEEMEFPWFSYAQTEQGNMMTEDVWFARHAHEAGYSIKGVGSVRCGHMKKVNLADFAPPAYPEKEETNG